MPEKTVTRSREPSSLSRFYLILFNGISGMGWTYVLFLAMSTLFDPSNAVKYDSLDYLNPILPYIKPVSQSTNQISASIASLLRQYIPSVYSSTFFALLPVQSLAILEVVHVLLGLVRSPLPTTLMQVSSRLFCVWAIVVRYPATHTNPIYTTMISAWALTEVPRYMFYMISLMGVEPPKALVWLRYSTFYILYPLGASSEAFLMLSTIPEWANNAWVSWAPEDYVRAGLFCIWWPGLYAMYSHMMQQRRKVLGTGKGRKLGGKPKNRVKAD
ncbi:PTPLA-domain-containing protein [Hygrophoropsis aurantiaca]|uniref:PTPLA-domain-containing protein n=1 Tax=Hygrophoropsis aurantiaca TaxID=72124 RepID=A0ACB8AB39_9AGAM|nr:PTPLA-domain-containing protein [Hygrophoropsis aurantiaca]